MFVKVLTVDLTVSPPTVEPKNRSRFVVFVSKGCLTMKTD